MAGFEVITEDDMNLTRSSRTRRRSRFPCLAEPINWHR